MILSTGDLGIADKIREGGKRVRAGQEIRILDLDADAGKGSGIFDNGDGAKIASRVSILSGRHQHHPAGGEAGMTVPSFSPIAIGARCWIGERAVVMASVGAAAVVGAGSVVVRDVPDGVTVAGNPARLIAASWMKTGKPAASKAASNVAAVR